MIAFLVGIACGVLLTLGCARLLLAVVNYHNRKDDGG